MNNKSTNLGEVLFKIWKQRGSRKRITKKVVKKLLSKGLIEPLDTSGEWFELTSKGYQVTLKWRQKNTNWYKRIRI